MEAAEVAAVVGKVAERLYAEDYDDEQYEGITEESVAEVMRWLELEIKLAAGAAELPLPPPMTPPAALYVATVGKESCGSSLSGPASTVMASVDGRSAAATPPLAQAVAWAPWPFVPQPAARDEEEEDEAAADEWVSQVLTDGPDVEGQCDSQ